jgi:uncharacterized membrane protein YqjE
MAVQERDIRSSQFNRVDGRFGNHHDNSEQDLPLSELLRRIAQDAGALAQQEVQLAKLELRESAQGYARDAARLGMAAGVGLMGALAVTAFAIIGLGDLLDNYWLSALIVSVVLLATAGMLAKGAIGHMKKNSLAPAETLRTLQEDKQWAQREAQDFKQQLKAKH